MQAADSFMSPLWWATLGVLLLAAEIILGNFIVTFFGLSALIVALISFLGLTSLPVQLILFSVLGVVGAVFLKKKLLHLSKEVFKNDINQILILEEDVKGHSEFKVHYQGTIWTAVNHSDRDLVKGEKVQIVKTQGIKLIVDKISSGEKL